MIAIGTFRTTGRHFLTIAWATPAWWRRAILAWECRGDFLVICLWFVGAYVGVAIYVNQMVP